MEFAIFDIETRIDKELVKSVYQTSYEIVRDEILVNEKGFFPVPFHIPISIAVGRVDTNRILVDVHHIEGDEEQIVRSFWNRVEGFGGTMVSFNGRGFDFPVLELQALKYGCQAPRYFNQKYGHRYRYSEDGHYDLYDFLTNSGACSIKGGLNILSQLIDLPGKGEIDGSKVHQVFDDGRLDEIHVYCEQDVIRTYFLFLAVERIRGRIDDGAFSRAMELTREFRELLL